MQGFEVSEHPQSLTPSEHIVYIPTTFFHLLLLSLV